MLTRVSPYTEAMIITLHTDALTCILSLIQKLGQKICYSNVELELHGDAGYLRSQFKDGSPLTAQRYNLKNAETC